MSVIQTVLSWLSSVFRPSPVFAADLQIFKAHQEFLALFEEVFGEQVMARVAMEDHADGGVAGFFCPSAQLNAVLSWMMAPTRATELPGHFTLVYVSPERRVRVQVALRVRHGALRVEHTIGEGTSPALAPVFAVAQPPDGTGRRSPCDRFLDMVVYVLDLVALDCDFSPAP